MNKNTIVQRQIIIERTPKEFLRVVLKRGKKKQSVQLIHETHTNRLELLLFAWKNAYNIPDANIIDTRIDYKNLPLIKAADYEIRFWLNEQIYQRRVKRARNLAILRHLESGTNHHNRKRFWVILDSAGKPIVANNILIEEWKRRGLLNKKAGFLDFDKEAIFSAHRLSEEDLQKEKVYRKFYKK